MSIRENFNLSAYLVIGAENTIRAKISAEKVSESPLRIEAAK